MASFTSVGDTATLSVADKGEKVSIALSGTYDMTIALQKEVGSPGSGMWQTIESWDTANATVAYTYYTTDYNEELQLIVLVDTSGTCTATITNAVDEYQHDLAIKDKVGNVLLDFSQEGPIIPSGKKLQYEDDRIVASTDAGTLALTRADHDDQIVYFSDADGAITLPNATGSGARFKVVLKTAATAMTIKVKAGTDEEFAGGVVGVDDDADAAYAWKAEDDDDTITLNGTSTGGKVHDWFEFVDIATGVWLVSGFITQSGGAEATPFSATVSSA